MKKSVILMVLLGLSMVFISCRAEKVNKVRKAPPGLDAVKTAAVKAVKAWIYEPYVREGKKIPVRFTEVVRFSSPGQK